MFDFPMTEANIWTAIYCLVFYVFLLLSNYKKGVLYYHENKLSHQYRWTMLFLIGFFFVTHCMKGDFFHMMEKVYEYDYTRGAYNYGEEVYPVIGKFVHSNYFLFRIIVWGGSYLLFIITSKRFTINPYNAAVLLLVTHAITFSYARATASMAIYFLGLSYLCNPSKRRIIGYCFGIALISLSVFFHRSALVMILMTIMLFVPLNKWTILIILSSLFVLADIFKDFFEVLAFSSEIDDNLAIKIQNYSDRTLTTGIAATVLSLLDYSSFLIPALYCSRVVYFRKNNVVPSSLKRLYAVTVGLVFAAFIFFLLGSSYVTFYYRILYMSMIPLTILLANFWNRGLLTKKQFLICILPGIFYHLSQYMYGVYLADLGIN